MSFLFFGSLLAATLLPSAFVSAGSIYGPILGKDNCPTTPLVRNVSEGIAGLEEAYIQERKLKADEALADWLQKTNSDFNTTSLPTVALAHSGGGYRAMLTGAGVVKAFDSRDSKVSTSGLLQATTYQTALSGGAWLLSGLIGNDYPTISSIVSSRWREALDDSALIPGNLIKAFDVYEDIEDDLDAKESAGFDDHIVTLIDLYGRLLSYQLFPEKNWDITLSKIVDSPSFRARNIPYPIITANSAISPAEKCVPPADTPDFEFTPHEFGSWDKGVEAFTQTEFLGNALHNSEPEDNGGCFTGYDNLGYILGTSSNLWNIFCAEAQSAWAQEAHNQLRENFFDLIDRADGEFISDEYGIFPNPFHGDAASPLVKDSELLYLVDGAENGQNVPLNPLLRPERNVDVIIASDNSATGDFVTVKNNYPDGAALLATYEQSLKNGLTRMPFIPSTDVFVREGLNKKPVFFGCGDKEKVTIVYLPNMEYSYPSDIETSELEIDADETDDMIENGMMVATRGEDEEWAECLGCAIMEKGGGVLPGVCEGCLEDYCYTE